MKMKYNIIKVILICFFTIKTIGVVAIPQIVFDAINVGNATELAKHFNASIELSILDNEQIYSKKQAEQVLRRFFTNNRVESFTLLHKGGRDGAKYAIGNLKSHNNKSFRVYFLLKDEGGSKLIHQLRIEEE